MIGKINSPLSIAHDSNKITICGTVTPSLLGAQKDDEILVEVLELKQGTRTTNCNGKFKVTDPNAELPWSMDASASGFATGSATSRSQATLKPKSGGGSGQPQVWNQPDPEIQITKL